MTSYSRMYLIPTQMYDKILKGASSLMGQVNNLDVNSGGKVTIRNVNKSCETPNLPEKDNNSSEITNLNNDPLNINERPEYAEAAMKGKLSDDEGNIDHDPTLILSPDMSKLYDDAGIQTDSNNVDADAQTEPNNSNVNTQTVNNNSDGNTQTDHVTNVESSIQTENNNKNVETQIGEKRMDSSMQTINNNKNVETQIGEKRLDTSMQTVNNNKNVETQIGNQRKESSMQANIKPKTSSKEIQTKSSKVNKELINQIVSKLVDQIPEDGFPAKRARHNAAFRTGQIDTSELKLPSNESFRKLVNHSELVPKSSGAKTSSTKYNVKFQTFEKKKRPEIEITPASPPVQSNLEYAKYEDFFPMKIMSQSNAPVTVSKEKNLRGRSSKISTLKPQQRNKRIENNSYYDLYENNLGTLTSNQPRQVVTKDSDYDLYGNEGQRSTFKSAKQITRGKTLEEEKFRRDFKARDREILKNRRITNKSKKVIVSYPNDDDIPKNIIIDRSKDKKYVTNPLTAEEKKEKSRPLQIIKKKTAKEKRLDKLKIAEATRKKQVNEDYINVPNEKVELKRKREKATKSKNVNENIRRSSRQKKKNVNYNDDDYDMY